MVDENGITWDVCKECYEGEKIMKTAAERYTEYNAFVDKQLRDGVYNTIPHCDSRILHDPSICEHCDRPEWQVKRGSLHIAWTGEVPEAGQIPCEADATRPAGSDSDHRLWGGNKPTSAFGDPSWPEETFVFRVMYG